MGKEFGLNNMNSMTKNDDKTCGLNDMNCVGEEEKDCALDDMNCLGKNDDKSCSLDNMNCEEK